MASLNCALNERFNTEIVISDSSMACQELDLSESRPLNESEQERLEVCWSQILPFLKMGDAVTLPLPKGDKRLLPIDQFFKHGRLMIDKQFADSFPILHHPEMYDRLGRDAMTVGLSGIDEDYLEELFKHFPNVVNLTLENICILRDIIGAPSKIEHLKLLRCQLNASFTTKWFESMCSTIQSLYLDETPCGEFVKHTYFKWKEAPDVTRYIDALAKSKIRDVTFVGMSNCWDVERLEYLESLKIGSMVRGCLPYSAVLYERDNPKSKYHNFTAKNLKRLEVNAKTATHRQLGDIFPSLEYLEINSPCGNGATINSTLELKCFVLTGEPLVTVLDKIAKSLHQRIILRIIRCDSEETRSQLNPGNNHLVETIYSYENPAPEEPNLILHKLDDHCLLEVFSYLSLTDYLQLYNTHSHFARILSECVVSQRKFEIKKELITEYPLSGEYEAAYKAVLANIHSLSLESIPEPQVYEIFSCCSGKLIELELSQIELERKGGKTPFPALPSELTTLLLDEVSLSQNIWTAWCRRLKSNLRVLKQSSSYLNNMNVKLDNLREYVGKFHGEWNVPKHLPLLLAQNKDTLEHLTLVFDRRNHSIFEDADNAMSDVLPKLKNLKKLHLRCFKPRRPCNISGLPRLEELNVDVCRKLIVNKENIKKLAMYESWLNDNHPLTLEGAAEFKNLEELELLRLTFSDYKPLQALQQLRTLRVNSHFDERTLYEIINDLHQLTTIEASCRLSPVFQFWLRRYSQLHKRHLNIVRGQMDCYNQDL